MQSVNTNLQKTIETTISGLQKSLQKAISDAQKASSDAQKAANQLSLQGKVISLIESSIKTANGLISDLSKTVSNKTNEVKNKVLKAVNERLNALEVKQAKIEATAAKLINTTATVGKVDSIAQGLRETYNKSFEAQAVKWNEEARRQSEAFLAQVKAGTATQTIIKEGIKTVDDAVKKAQNIIEDKIQKFPVTTPVNNSALDKIKADLTNLNTKIREQEKVNAEGNKKLDEILPKINSILLTIAGIPLIAGRAADLIRPSIPTLPQIESATGTAVCKSLNGGCAGTAINDAANGIKNNNNNNTNALLNALGAASDLANLALLPKLIISLAINFLVALVASFRGSVNGCT